jgi:hypothetical protein
VNTLAQQQDALLQALWQPHGTAPYSPRGLAAYRSNGLELAQRALAGAYPVVAQLLGEENFTALAHGLWAGHPPQRGDVAQWGAQLAQHIESLPDLSGEEPFMADVARVEWLLHTAATAADAQLDAASLQILAQHDPANFTLVLSPGAACVASPYPVVSIINAHLSGEPSLEEAGRRLRGGFAETALVWREGFKPRLREALPGEAGFIAALQEKRSLADSLQAAPELDFNQWLAPAVHGGLLVAAALL